MASDKFILSNEEKEILPTELAVDTLIYQLVRSAELIFNCEKMFRQGAYFEQQGRYKDAASIYFSILSNQELDFLLNNRNLKNDSTLSCGDLKRRSYRRMVDIQEKRRDAYQVDILRAEQALYQLYATESEESFFTERVIKYADAAKVKNSDVSDYPGYLKERVQYFRQEKQRELSLERRKKEARKEVFSGLRNDALVILNQISAAPELTQKRVEVQSDDKRLIILFEQDTNMISAYFDENSYNLSAYKSYHEKTVAKTLAEFLTNAEQEYFNEIDSIVLKFTGSADSTPFQDDLFIEDEEYEDLRMSVYLCDPYDERYPRNVFDFHKIRKGKKLKDKDLAMNTALGHLRAYHRYQVLESVMPGHSTLISPPEFCASVARAMGNKYRYVNVKMTIYIKDADNKVWETRVNQQNAPQRTSPN
mgnify:FL=1